MSAGPKFDPEKMISKSYSEGEGIELSETYREHIDKRYGGKLDPKNKKMIKHKHNRRQRRVRKEQERNWL